jgi:uncharacterized protein
LNRSCLREFGSNEMPSAEAVMSVGLLALLDDVAAFAKIAAASLDDVGAATLKAGTKAAGVVIDDAAVTPRYVVGFAAERELSIVAKIARGSLRNKLLILLPAALAISFLAPWLMTPLLMLGGAYLSFEGAEKIHATLFPHAAHEAEEGDLAAADPRDLEDRTVAGAIKTDFILSAEIMTITLAAVPDGSFWMRAVILAVVGAGITAAVYGAVAVIVKADDVGVRLAESSVGMVRAIGRGLVKGMPAFLKLLAVVGTAAMVWVGGGIIVHGLEEFGLTSPARAIHDVAEAVEHGAGAAGGALGWLVTAAGSGLVGLALGAILIPLVSLVLVPLWQRIAGALSDADAEPGRG